MATVRSIVGRFGVHVSACTPTILIIFVALSSSELTWCKYRDSTWRLVKLISFHILLSSSHHSTLNTGTCRAHRYIKTKQKLKSLCCVNTDAKNLILFDIAALNLAKCLLQQTLKFQCLVLACLLTYLLTPWRRVLLEKLASLQLVKKFPAFYGTRRILTALTSVRHMSLSWASPIQSS